MGCWERGRAVDIQKQQQGEYKRIEILQSLQISFCALHDSLAVKCRCSTDSLSAKVQGLGQEK